MSSFVDQHQLSSYATPVAGGALAASVVLSNDNTTVTGYNAHDADATIHVQDSTLASKPAASVTGRKWMTVDSSAVALYFDTGGAWLPLNTFPSGGSFAGLITSTKTGNFFLDQAATTGNVYAQITNTSGQSYWGLESSVGGTIVTGSTAYDTVLTGQTGITFSANNGSAVSMRLNSSHALNVVGALTTGGLLTIQTRILNTAADLDIDSNGANAVRINRTGGTGGFIVYAGNTSTTNLVITDAGVTTFRAGVSGITTLSGTGAVSGFTSAAFGGTLSTTAALAVASGQKMYVDGVAATGDTYIYESSANVLSFVANAQEAIQLIKGAAGVVPTATCLVLTVADGTAISPVYNVQQVSVSGADSGGAGYRVLIVPNAP